VIESGQQIDEKAFKEALKYFGYDKVLQDNALLGELVMALVAQVNQRQARIEAAAAIEPIDDNASVVVLMSAGYNTCREQFRRALGVDNHLTDSSKLVERTDDN
jgi:hypothetical protein